MLHRKGQNKFLCQFSLLGQEPTFVPLKDQTKIAADDTLFFDFYLCKEIRLDVSCESSARQRIHMKYQVIFSLKNNEKVFINVVCCSPETSRTSPFTSSKFCKKQSHSLFELKRSLPQVGFEPGTARSVSQRFTH